MSTLGHQYDNSLGIQCLWLSAFANELYAV